MIPAKLKSFYQAIRKRPSIPMISQAEATECGHACLAMALGSFGYHIDLLTLRQQHPPSLRGQTLGQIKRLAESYGLQAKALKVNLAGLKQLKAPAVLHWDLNHFVIFKKATSAKVVIHDPAQGIRSLTWEQVARHFSGVALVLTAGPGFKPEVHRATLKLRDFFTNNDIWRGQNPTPNSGLKSGLGLLLLLSFGLLFVASLLPLGNQLMIDQVLKQPGTNQEDPYPWLVLLVTALVGISTINTGISILRSYLLLHLTNILSSHLSTKVFHHLLGLPLAWFEKRHIGDVVSRFSSTDHIRSLLTGTLVSSIIDSFMALFMGILMLLYSPLLTLISALIVAIFVVFRLTFFRLMRQMSEATIVASAKSDSNFMETVRGIQSIKVFGKEADRQRLWKKHFVEVIDTNTRLGMFSANISSAESMLSTIETALIVFIGATFVIKGSFTPGMFIAFFSYHGQFSGKALSLLENLLDYKMLDLHLSRLADIVLSPIHKKTKALAILPSENQAVPPPVLDGSLRIENLGFRFGADDLWLFRNLCITVKPGECVVIAGPSGCGKSTLAKIILGLIDPVEGAVLVDGQKLSMVLGHDKSFFSCGVMQEDQLFSGTIADNITFFDATPDERRLHQCAQLACIETEILGMPMGYQSVLGDMGSVLSTGQKQRLLLARALYARPKILVLDEATCHLDSSLEQTLLAALGDLPITRIIITHRPQTIPYAHHVIELGPQNSHPPTV